MITENDEVVNWIYSHIKNAVDEHKSISENGTNKGASDIIDHFLNLIKQTKTYFGALKAVEAAIYIVNNLDFDNYREVSQRSKFKNTFIML